MNRDQARKALKDAGINTSTLTDIQLKKLRAILTNRLIRSNIYQGEIKLSRARKNLNFIRVDTYQWNGRDAISFNDDGFIGIASWASDINVKPFISALIEWSQWMVGYEPLTEYEKRVIQFEKGATKKGYCFDRDDVGRYCDILPSGGLGDIYVD